MKNMKEFFKNISQTGWIIISIAIISILLVIINVYAKKEDSGIVFLGNQDSVPKEDQVGYNKEESLSNLEKSLTNTTDNVFSAEDVLDGKYGNSVEEATLFVKNTKEVKILVVIDTDKYQAQGIEAKKCGKFILEGRGAYKAKGHT